VTAAEAPGCRNLSRRTVKAFSARALVAQCVALASGAGLQRAMRIKTAILVVFAAVVSDNCHRGSATPGRSVLRLVRESTMSEPLAAEYRRSLPAVDVRLVDFVGSVATVDAIQRGDADFGFALADVAYSAYVALEERPRPARTQLRGIAALQVTAVHLMARPGLDVRDVDDLATLHVATGTEFSGLARLAPLILRAYGVDLDSVRRELLATESIAAALANGTIDAAFATGYYPSPIVSAATRAGASLVPIDGPIAERLRHEYPFVRKLRIPAGTYAGQRHDVKTVGVDRLLVCREDLDERLVYDLTHQLLEALPKLSSLLKTSLRLMDLDQASATPIPLHLGAAQYYRERELAR